jgi:MYXO-CTERM domain-containing protein
MLFLGNSYTFQNNLEAQVAAVFAAAGETVQAERLANPGWRFVDHEGAIETAGSDHALAFAEPHDWVILQEQSQIPGFPDGQVDVEASRDSAVVLDGYAAATGAQTMFLMTWGRRDGDNTNPDLYPDFETMQARLTDGYLTYVSLASADGTPAWVAPAGLAWARVYDDVVAGGGDPTAPDSPFYQLYVDDGSHPSPRGTYLAACVLYKSLTGRSPVGLDAPADIADAAYLQGVAEATVTEAADTLAFPWEPADDTGVPDTGVPDTGVPDTGDDTSEDPDTASDLDDDTGVPDTSVDDTDDGDDNDAEGCGCTSGGGAGGWIVAVMAALGVRRRRSND